MGRLPTNTVSYFPHDTDAQHKKTLTIIRGEFGLQGTGFWWALLEWLGATEGHYYNGQKPQDLEFLLQKLGIPTQVGTEILNKLAYLDAIDPVLWEHKVIYSQNFVQRLEQVYSKRQREIPSKPCFCDSNCDHSGITNKISVTETLILSPVMPQRKIDIKDTILNKGNGHSDENLKGSVPLEELVDLGKQSKKDPPEWQQWRKQIFAQLKERRAYPLTKGQIAGEAKQMSWFFQNGYCPEQIIKAYDLMKKEPFWSVKSLTLMSVAKQIGEVLKNGNGQKTQEQSKYSGMIQK